MGGFGSVLAEIDHLQGIDVSIIIVEIATDVNKPNGQFRIHPTKEAVLSYLQTLPVRKVCHIYDDIDDNI